MRCTGGQPACSPCARPTGQRECSAGCQWQVQFSKSFKAEAPKARCRSFKAAAALMVHPDGSVQWNVQGGSPEGTLAWVRQKGCFGADGIVVPVLASTGREAYAGGGFHSGAATKHATTTVVDTYSARGRSGQPNSTPPVSQLPSSKDNQGGKRASAAMRTPNAAREGAPHGESSDHLRLDQRDITVQTAATRRSRPTRLTAPRHHCSVQ